MTAVLNDLGLYAVKTHSPDLDLDFVMVVAGDDARRTEIAIQYETAVDGERVSYFPVEWCDDNDPDAYDIDFDTLRSYKALDVETYV